MLSARAYSFRQQSRLAISLSWIGGYTNVVAFMVCGAVASHVTGNVTHLGRFFAQGNRADALFMAFMWAAFFSGAAASAVLTEIARRSGMASKYIPPMLVEALLLSSLAYLIRENPKSPPDDATLYYWMGGLAALAMGLQNATITRISGAVIRTTHLTGVTTDLGIETVQYLMWCLDYIGGRDWSRASRVFRMSTRHPSFLRVMLLGSIIGSFLFGATAGTLIFMRFPAFCLLLPVAFLVWIIFVDWRTPIADVRELDVMADSELRVFGIVKSLLPPELGIWRVAPRGHGAWHRPPDFQQWAEMIPQRWRVIILALSPTTRFEHNSILNLSAALDKLHQERRKLVLSGITPLQYQNLVKQGIGRAMDMENLCPDLEFAVARAIDLLAEARPARAEVDGDEGLDFEAPPPQAAHPPAAPERAIVDEAAVVSRESIIPEESVVYEKSVEHTEPVFYDEAVIEGASIAFDGNPAAEPPLVAAHAASHDNAANRLATGETSSGQTAMVYVEPTPPEAAATNSEPAAREEPVGLDMPLFRQTPVAPETPIVQEKQIVRDDPVSRPAPIPRVKGTALVEPVTVKDTDAAEVGRADGYADEADANNPAHGVSAAGGDEDAADPMAWLRARRDIHPAVSAALPHSAKR